MIVAVDPAPIASGFARAPGVVTILTMFVEVEKFEFPRLFVAKTCAEKLSPTFKFGKVHSKGEAEIAFVVHVLPPGVRTAVYELIGAPPSELGAFQETVKLLSPD